MRIMTVRLFGALIVLSLIATACGAETEIEVAGDPADTTVVSASNSGTASVPAVLDFLGDLTRPRGSLVTTTVDGAAASVVLEEGASVVVAAGAFAAATELTTQVVDLDFSTVLGESAPWSRAYVVSTVDDVNLGAPVTIEIPRPAAELRAVQMIDGEIVPVEVTGDATSAQIEIPHFSDVVTLVLNTWGEEAAEAARVEVARLSQGPPLDDTPANFLRTCLVLLLSLFGGGDEFYKQLVYSSCTNALIARSAPDGKHVSTACVGDRISGGLDFQPAVDACAADNDGEGDSGDQTETGEIAEPDENATAPSGDIGPLSWSGPMVYMGPFDGISDDPLIEITRTPGTDTFTMHAQFSFTGTFKYDNDGTICTQLDQNTFDGEGTFFLGAWGTADGQVIVINGEFRSSRSFTGCPAEPRETGTTGSMALLITETGLVNADAKQSGQDWEFTWDLAGVPVPFDG